MRKRWTILFEIKLNEINHLIMKTLITHNWPNLTLKYLIEFNQNNSAHIVIKLHLNTPVTFLWNQTQLYLCACCKNKKATRKTNNNNTTLWHKKEWKKKLTERRERKKRHLKCHHFNFSHIIFYCFVVNIINVD